TISGGYRSTGTRRGPSCITSIVTPQTVQPRRRGFSDGRFRISLKRCYLVLMPCPNRGGENIREHYVIEVIQCPALSGYPTLVFRTLSVSINFTRIEGLLVLKNLRILLVILFPRDTAAVTVLDSNDVWAFYEGMSRHDIWHLGVDQQYPFVFERSLS